MLLDISAGSIFAAVIPHRLRSRVSGAYTFVNYGVRVLGSLAGGLLGSAIGLRPTLWIGAVGALPACSSAPVARATAARAAGGAATTTDVRTLGSMVVNRDEKRGRASSFGEVADAYERARPGYPEDAVRWLTGDEPCDVVDLGAGTGKLTRSLVALGHRVTAVEPLAEMREHLRAAVPDATALEGSAEGLPSAGRERRRCHLRAGIPLVRPCDGTRRDRTRAATRRLAGARVEHARRPRALGGEAFEARDGE